MTSWWDAVVVLFTGKDVAILGPRDAGKTTLYDFLQHRTVRTASPRTQTVAVTKRDIARRKDLKLSIKKGADVPGSDVYYPDWEKLFRKADVVFYVFDASLARTDADYAARLSQDGRHLKKWGVRDKTIYLVGTHRDTDPISTDFGPAKYSDVILELDVIEALRSRVRATSVAVGDLCNDRSAETLLRRVMGR